MKKVISIALVLVLALTLLASCGADYKLEGTAKEILDKVLEKKPTDFASATLTDDPSFPDLTKSENADMLGYYIGVKDNTIVEDIAVSESAFGMQPYSMIVLKVKEGTDVDATKKAILDGIDMRKWMCVNADKLVVTNCGNVIFILMSTDEFYNVDEGLKTFVEITENHADEALERTFA